MKSVLLVLGVLVLAIAGFFVFNKKTQEPQPATSQNDQVDSGTQTPTASLAFSNPKKSAHYESNTPEHGETLAGVPINVVIDFNFDLAKPSEIRVYSGGGDITVGETVIDANKLSMRRAIDPEAQDDKYTVDYKACWPDGSCHDGNFEFVIDRTQASQFADQTSKKEIIIKMMQIKFQPLKVKVSKGTKITWVNDDTAEHYVNTDSHPAHTYYLAQNSKLLKSGESFSLTLSQAGIYHYHYSIHASSMAGALLVE